MISGKPLLRKEVHYVEAQGSNGINIVKSAQLSQRNRQQFVSVPAIRITQIGWVKVRLPGRDEALTLVVCRLAGQSQFCFVSFVGWLD